MSQLSCDFVGILIKEDDIFIPKVWSGALTTIIEDFPIRVDQCNPSLLTKSLMFDAGIRDSSCKFTNLWINEGLTTWFTVPLRDEIEFHWIFYCWLFSTVQINSGNGENL